jgi:hypothetical protein
MTSTQPTSRPSKTRSLLAASATVAALAAAGCGSSTVYLGQSAHQRSVPITYGVAAPTAEQQITKVWHTAQDAAARGDYAAFKASLTPQAASIADAYGGATLLVNYKPHTLVSIKVHGDTAKTVDRGVDGQNPGVFVKTSDGWRIGVDVSQMPTK